jgi:hypothetical protein
MTEHITIGDVSPRIQYLADGVQTQFTYPFPIFEDSDLKVWFDEAEQTTGFTVSGAGSSSGGAVDFGAPPAAGVRVTLRRDVPVERTTDFQEGGAFRAKTINDELDRQTAMIQQLAEEDDRALRAAPTDDGAGLVLPAKDARATKLLGFDGDGNPIAADGSTGDVAVSAAMTPVVQAGTLAAARAAAGLKIGADVQGYDPATAKLDEAQEWTARQTFREPIASPHVIDWRAMVTVKPATIGDRLMSVWTGDASDSGAVSVVYDENYEYLAGGNTTDAKIRITKIDRTTRATIAVYNGAAGEESAHHMILLGEHLYVSCTTTPGKVVKIDPSTMIKVAAWTGAPGEDTAKFMTSDGTYLYVCLFDASPGKVAKIDPSDMTTAGVWIGASYQTFPQGIDWTGAHLLVGLDLVPFELIKVDPATMATSALPYADNRFLDSRRAIYSGATTRSGQKVAMTAGDKITGVDFLLDKVGVPTGTATVRIRQSSDDNIVGTPGTVDVSTLPSSATNPIWVRLRPAAPIEIQNTEDHYVLIEYSGGDASNYLGLRYDSTDRTNGVLADYNGSYSTVGTADASIRIYPNNVFYAANLSAWNDGETYGNHALSSNGKVYATTYGLDPDRLIRIDWVNMIESDKLILNSGENNTTSPVSVGDTIMVPCNLSPGRVVRCRDTDNGLVREGSWIAANGQDGFYHVAFDGHYTWLATSTAPPKLLRKIIWPIEETGT